MSSLIHDILEQIDRLDEAGQQELRDALRQRTRAQWGKLAEVERKHSQVQGVCEDDIDRAVDEVRYGKKLS